MRWAIESDLINGTRVRCEEGIVTMLIAEDLVWTDLDHIDQCVQATAEINDLDTRSNHSMPLQRPTRMRRARMIITVDHSSLLQRPREVKVGKYEQREGSGRLSTVDFMIFRLVGSQREQKGGMGRGTISHRFVFDEEEKQRWWYPYITIEQCSFYCQGWVTWGS